MVILNTKSGKTIEIIIPEELWETDMGKKVKEEAEKIKRSIRDYQNKRPFREWRDYMSRKTGKFENSDTM